MSSIPPQASLESPNTANEERRSFLRWAVHGLGVLFAAVLGIPAVAYLLDARNRSAPKSSYRRVQGISLSELQPNVPRQGVIRDVRHDAWNLSQDVVGRVWVMKSSSGKVQAFTTICPHLGCSINLDPPGSDGTYRGFTCPCHGGKFHIDGSLDTQAPQNPAPRGMDLLESRPDPADPENALQVVYQNFYQARHDKVVKK